MYKKIYLVALFFILFVSISSLAYMQIKILNLEHKNEFLQSENKALKKSINKLYKNFQDFSNNRSKTPQENLSPDKEMFPDFGDFSDIDQQFKEMEKQMEDINRFFSNPDDFGIHLKINGFNPGSQMSIIKNFSINGKNFLYSINSSNGKISGTIKGDNKKVLKDLQDRLKKLGLKTDIKNDTLSFSGEKIDINKITGTIDEYINKNYNKLQDSKQKKKKLIPGKDYF